MLCFCLLPVWFLAALSLLEACQHLHAFMAVRDVFMPTETSQGGRNSALNFQGKVVPFLKEMSDSLKV